LATVFGKRLGFIDGLPSPCLVLMDVLLGLRVEVDSRISV
jgi:hypothetical protein